VNRPSVAIGTSYPPRQNRHRRSHKANQPIRQNLLMAQSDKSRGSGAGPQQPFN
jgi:hypothetical protein